MNVHILNGDSLKEQFPSSLDGKIIVARECLVDGDVSGKTLPDLYNTRKTFLEKHYAIPPAEYASGTETEFKKIINLPGDADVTLWFEDDLFCQVNLWFCAHLIHDYGNVEQVYLARPTTDVRYGFGGMNKKELSHAYQQRTEINDYNLAALSLLWRSYQEQQWKKMLALAQNIWEDLPFVEKAVLANIERFPEDGSPGRPKRTLQTIVNEIGDEEFGPVFREFHKRESIYGYGDLQVKRLFDEIKAGD
ncbi:MAG: DUF1835 domain-containing protein [Balneolaceae bacterium]|nr:DUF1835 domain-containing protein [Balneolaceae bacterium]